MNTKKPVFKDQQPGYPSLKASKVDRRKFLVLLGGGVASSALISACYDSNDLDEEEIDDNKHVEIDTNEPLAGGQVAPDYYDRRLPAFGFHSLRAHSDNTTVVYAITTRFEEWAFEQAPEQDLLTAVNEQLSQSFRGYEFGEEDKLPLIEQMVQEVLEEQFRETKGLDPAFVDVSFVVERIDYNEELAGDVAPDPEWPADPTDPR